jgi:hypothetical protein
MRIWCIQIGIVLVLHYHFCFLKDIRINSAHLPDKWWIWDFDNLRILLIHSDSIKFLSLRFCPTSGIFFHRFHDRHEILSPLKWAMFSEFRAFQYPGPHILILCYICILTSGTVIKWGKRTWALWRISS